MQQQHLPHEEASGQSAIHLYTTNNSYISIKRAIENWGEERTTKENSLQSEFKRSLTMSLAHSSQLSNIFRDFLNSFHLHWDYGFGQMFVNSDVIHHSQSICLLNAKFLDQR